MTERFNKAYNSLIDAFFNGTLAKGHCSCCAVGNIVAGAYGAKVTIDLEKENMAVCTMEETYIWQRLFFTTNADCYYDRHKDGNWYTEKEIDEALELIKATGYSEEELSEVEKAFELNTNIILDTYENYSEQEILEDQYNGLCAVFDILCMLDNTPIEPQYKDKLKEKEGLILTA